MKIAIFTDSFFPQVNGVVTALVNLAENLADRGHKIIIIAPKYRKQQEYVYPGIRVVRVNSVAARFYDDFRWTVPFPLWCYWKLKREEIDIVHFMTPFFISFFGIKFARLTKVPCVGTFHTLITDPAYFTHLFKGPMKITQEGTCVYANLYYDRADHVTTPSKEAARMIEANGCTTSIEVISNGVVLDSFDNSRSGAFREKYGLGDGVVLFIGRIAHEKNLTVLIDAFSKVHERIPEAQLLIVGDGPQWDLFKSYAQKQSCSGSIIFTGVIDHDELVGSGIFGCASLFATASETETQGITILESQANGLLSVGVRRGGVMELIEDGKNGYLVEPGDVSAMAEKIVYILENKDSLEDMKKNVLEMVKAHKIEKIVDRWDELYRDLIDKNNRGLLPKKDYIHFYFMLKAISEYISFDFKSALPFF